MRSALPAIVALFLTATSAAEQAPSLTFQIQTPDGEKLPCRVFVRDDAGQPVPADLLPRRVDHMSIDGDQTLTLSAGTYTYAVEHGPEWEHVEGQITLVEGDHREIAVTLRRMIDLDREGWYAGDLHIHRELDDIETVIRAADLDIAPVITWWNSRNLWADRPIPEAPLAQLDGSRFYRVMAGEDEREGGALLYFGLHRPVDIAGASREFPSPMVYVEQARAQVPGVHIDIEKPFWWDVPVWLAIAKPDTVGLANNHMCRATMYESEAWGRPRDTNQFPAPLGNGFWTQEIYYHILNAGLRLPPSAGSASGVLPNPVGYNRVYVHLDDPLSWNGWWDGLRAGRSFVSNGPLLICRANGELPGTVFQGTGDRPLRVSIDATLTATDHVPELEIVRNGEVILSIPCTEDLTQRITTDFTMAESGWFLVRAITDNHQTFRFASTAPFYVELGNNPQRISRSSATFFLNWVNERIDRIAETVTDRMQLAEILQSHHAARSFWEARVEQATAP